MAVKVQAATEDVLITALRPDSAAKPDASSKPAEAGDGMKYVRCDPFSGTDRPEQRQGGLSRGLVAPHGRHREAADHERRSPRVSVARTVRAWREAS